MKSVRMVRVVSMALVVIAATLAGCQSDGMSGTSSSGSSSSGSGSGGGSGGY